MFRTNITTRTATLRLKLREVTPVAGALGDSFGSFVVGLADAIKASNGLRGHFDRTDVSCIGVYPDHLVVQYRCGSVHFDVFVNEIKNFIPQVKAYVEQWVGRPVQWLDYSFDVANGEATMGYDPLQFDVGFLGQPYEESYMNDAYLNSHVPASAQGIDLPIPSHVDTVPIINAQPGEPNVV